MDYKYVLQGNTVSEIAEQFAELAASRGRLVKDKKPNGNQFAKWMPEGNEIKAFTPSVKFELPEYTVVGLQPATAEVTVFFTKLQTAQNVQKIREQKAATITSRLQRDIAEAQRLGLRIPGLETISTDVAPVEEGSSAGPEVQDGE